MSTPGTRQRQRGRSPTALQARRSTIKDKRVLAVVRAERWQRQTERARKRDWLKARTGRRASIESQRIIGGPISTDACTSAAADLGVADGRSLARIDVSEEGPLAPDNQLAVLHKKPFAKPASNNFNKRAISSTSPPKDRTNSAREQYYEMHMLRSMWGGTPGRIPDPWSEHTMSRRRPRSSKSQAPSRKDRERAGRLFRKKKSDFPWESQPGWDEPHVFFTRSSPVPSVKWHLRRVEATTGYSAPVSHEPTLAPVSVPDRPTPTWRGGRGAPRPRERAGVRTPALPSAILEMGERREVEPLASAADRRRRSRGSSSSSSSRGSRMSVIQGRTRPVTAGYDRSIPVGRFETSRDVKRERLRVLDTQAMLFSEAGAAFATLLARGIRRLGPDEATLAESDRHLVWIAEISGPGGTPYEGALFRVRIVLGDYPSRPPKSIVFLTPVFHPAVEYKPDARLHVHWSEGAARWSRRFTLAAVADIVLHLLRYPTASFEAGREAADLYASDRTEFALRAAMAAQRDAGGHGMSVKSRDRYEDRMRAYERRCQRPPDTLYGAFVPKSAWLEDVEDHGRKRMCRVAGHRMVLFPGFALQERKIGAASAGGRRFNEGSRWAPGRRQLVGVGGFSKMRSGDRAFKREEDMLGPVGASPASHDYSKALVRPATSIGLVGSFDLNMWRREGEGDENDSGETTGTEVEADSDVDDGEGDVGGQGKREQKRRDGENYVAENQQQKVLLSSQRLYDSGQYEETLSEIRRTIAGREEALGRKIGPMKVVGAMMRAVRCYGKTLHGLPRKNGE